MASGWLESNILCKNAFRASIMLKELQCLRQGPGIKDGANSSRSPRAGEGRRAVQNLQVQGFPVNPREPTAETL